MKVRIQEYEGTPQEIEQLLGKQVKPSVESTQPKVVVINQAKPKPVKKPFIPHKHKKQVNSWTRKEKRILREHPLVDDAIKLLPNRTRGAILVERWKLRIKNPKVYDARPVKDREPNKNIVRLKFMGKRAKYYMDAYNWSRSKAMVQASADYKNGKVDPLLTASVKPEPEKVQVYKVVRWDSTTGKTKTVDVFSNFDDAKKCIETCKVQDLSINEEYHYAILKGE